MPGNKCQAISGCWLKDCSYSFPRLPQADAQTLKALSHRLIVAAIALGQPLAGPSVAVEPDHFVEPLCRNPAVSNRNA